ncbi:MFS transporter [Allosalinactinospora lopnorensis]|uniref:MFS transporter n=1 Tax=Allosalinactinospora lopnorensis TaxID=1352348 RepID=UPI000AD67699|nr:MFS transporter [Allosalinactinospora lopnorensis]
MVNGASATESGLLMLPIVGGMLTSSITTGRIISATGRYKMWPTLGASVAAVGLVLLSWMDAGTSYAYNAAAMLVLGLGVGMVMQNLVLIVQNSAPRHVLGAATSGINYFRQIGASFGVAVFGSVFIGRLNDQLAATPAGVPEGVDVRGGEAGISSLTPEMLRSLPEPVREFIVRAFADALPPVFLFGVPIVLVGVLLSFFIVEKPLATTIGEAERDPGAEPADTTGKAPAE